MKSTQRVLFLRQLARFKGLSDGAKVTLLEFVYHFWSEDKLIPSYTEICNLRSVVRSTVQLHIEELEKVGVLVSVRLPSNRKRYRLDMEALNKDAEVPKPESVKPQAVHRKPVAKYGTAELCGYFMFLRGQLTGKAESYSRMQYLQMKQFHKAYGSSVLIAAMDKFDKIYNRRHWPFTLDSFYEQCDSLVSGDSENSPKKNKGGE